MFVGPVLTVPLMLLAVQDIGSGPHAQTPFHIKVAMTFSYLRYGLEGLIESLYGNNRADTICPKGEIFCIFSKANYLKGFVSFDDANCFVSIVALILYYLLFTAGAFVMIKMRLSTTRSNYVAVQYVNRFVKTHLNFATYK